MTRLRPQSAVSPRESFESSNRGVSVFQKRGTSILSTASKLCATTYLLVCLFGANSAVAEEAEVSVDDALELVLEAASETAALLTSENSFKDLSTKDVFTKASEKEKSKTADPKTAGIEAMPTKVSFKSKVDVQDPSPLAAALQEALLNISNFQNSQRPVPAGAMQQPSGIEPAAKTTTELESTASSSTATPTVASLAKDVQASVATQADKAKQLVYVDSKAKDEMVLATVAPSVASVSTLPKPKAPLKSDLDSYFDDVSPDRPVPETTSAKVSADTSQSTSVASVSSMPSASVIVDSLRVEPSADDVAPRTAQPVEATPPATEVQRIIPYQEPRVVITKQMRTLQPKIAKTLRFYFDRPLNSKDDSAWSVMHSFLGYGPAGMLALNSERGTRTNALSWMCQNGPLMGRRLFYIQDGYIRGVEGPGYQGHPCQFLAMLAQIGVQRDYPMAIQGRQLKVEDLINSEMYTCSSEKELTFKLIALSYYLNSDAQWTSETGETWDLAKILSLELGQPVNGSACGGTHRVMSISNAVRNRQMRGEPVDGPYVQAQDYVRQYQRYTLSLQNRNGSFSTQWFKGRADNGDKDRQLQTSGHMLEWLVYSLPRNELSDPRIVKGVEFLQNLMSRNRYRDWEVGPRGHAIRALALYHYRVFERQSPTPQASMVSSLWTTFR